MEADDRKAKHAARVELVDKLTESPEVRSMKVWKILQAFSEQQRTDGKPELDEWDLISFSAEYLTHISEKYTWLQQMAFPLVNFIHNAHYVKGAELGLYEEPKLFDSNGVLTSSKIEQPKIVGLNGEALTGSLPQQQQEVQEDSPQSSSPNGSGTTQSNQVS